MASWETAVNIRVRHNIEDRKAGGRRLGVGDERFGMVSAGVGEGAGIVGQLREILHGDNSIVGFCMRKGF